MNDALLAEIFEDAQSPVAVVPSDEKLGAIAALAKQQQDLEQEILDLEDLVTTKNARLQQIRTKDLPDMLKSLGMSSFKLVDGSEINVKLEYHASIKDENRERALSWMRDNEHGDLIKNQLALAFGKGEDAQADEVIEYLKGRKIPFDRKEGVHPMTLKAFVREQMENQRLIPTDLLGATVIEIAKITKPKQTNKRRS